MILKDIKYYYKVYGLKIKLDIEFLELLESNDVNYEINICIGIILSNVFDSIK